MTAPPTAVPADLRRAAALIRAVPDFPQPGILFRDIFPVFRDVAALESLTTHLLAHLFALNVKIDLVVGALCLWSGQGSMLTRAQALIRADFCLAQCLRSGWALALHLCANEASCRVQSPVHRT